MITFLKTNPHVILIPWYIVIIVLVTLVVVFLMGMWIIHLKHYKNLFIWTNGRQLDCDYEKLCFLRFKFKRFGMDGYILKYPPKAHLKKHIDKVDGGKHYRINLQIKGKGSFFVDKSIFRIRNRLVFFRPDKYPHSMVNGLKPRYVLSIGWAIFLKDKKR